MTDLISTLQLVLKDGGYHCALIQVNRRTAVTFEDDTLMGFGYVFDDPLSLVKDWQSVESSILQRYASHFREANEKAWNIYSVFLCAVGAADDQERVVRRIEENLERTRKIASCGAMTVDDVVTALLPIMPLQYRPTLDQENYEARLRRRIAAFAPEAVDAVLNHEVPPTNLVTILGNRT